MLHRGSAPWLALTACRGRQCERQRSDTATFGAPATADDMQVDDSAAGSRHAKRKLVDEQYDTRVAAAATTTAADTTVTVEPAAAAAASADVHSSAVPAGAGGAGPRCPICQDQTRAPFAAPCGHIACHECWQQWLPCVVFSSIFGQCPSLVVAAANSVRCVV